jgi:putative DNA methylase
MIPKECKRLAEVDFPIAEVSRHAAREKSIRHGHPSAFHLRWLHWPLASWLPCCRRPHATSL